MMLAAEVSKETHKATVTGSISGINPKDMDPLIGP